MIPFTTKPEQSLEIFEIATKMKAAGLPADFITRAADMALTYEGTFDLLTLWARENDQVEREEIVADLQEEIDSHQEVHRTPVERPRISFNELEAVAKRVLAHKAELRKKVDKWGGISKLAKATGIPQPSLSRFFSSPSLPRRTTLYKIANALNLPEHEIVFEWAA